MGWNTGFGSQISIAGNPSGIFIYSPSAGAGNLIGSWSSAAGVDAYGNSYPEGIFVAAGTISGPIPITIGNTGSSEISLQPQLNSTFTITTLISGILEAVAELSTTDSNEAIAGILGSLLLNTGSSTKMSTVLTSPIGTGTGAAVVLEAENDGNTDTAVITFGTVTTPDDSTEVFTPILTITPFAVVLYSGSSGVTVVTKNSGSGNIPIPATVSTVKGETWGSGGGGGTAASFGAAAAGGGEYACEPSLAVTAGGNLPYVVGAAGTGGIQNGAASTNGASSTLTGTSVTVTAHGGQRGASTNTNGSGGTGSTNTTHFNGGNGAVGAPGGTGGGGAGSSAGTGAAGGNGTTPGGNGSGAGQGGTAPSGGGNGGRGGTGVNGNGVAGSPPGGGGGGSSAGNNGGNGASGQVRVTYTSGAPGILMSISSAAFTDQFGNSIPIGTVLPGPGDGNSYPPGPLALNATATPQTVSSTSATLITGCSAAVQPGTYRFHARVIYKGGAAAGTANFSFSGPTASSPSINAMFITSAGTAGIGTQTAAAGAVDSPTLTTSNNVADIWGQTTFTAAGTWQLNVAEGTSGDTVIIVQATVELYPPT